jgi:integrase
MLAALEYEPIKYQALVHLALTSGLRKSELMALTWDDIDFQAGTIEVTKTRQYASHIGVHERDLHQKRNIRPSYINPTGHLEIYFQGIRPNRRH